MGTFEDDLKKLEVISQKLQSGNEGIEKSMALYEDGVKLADDLVKKLDTYKSKIEILSSEDKKQ